MILGCLIFYDDGAEMVSACLQSLKRVTDRVIAIDGAYREYPHKDFRSQADTMDVVKTLADEVIEAKEAWKDEATKRNVYLRLKSEKDFYFFLDADEVVEGKKPIQETLKFPIYRIKLNTLQGEIWLPGYYNRLFRHHNGMKYHLKHNNLVTPDGLCLSEPENNIPIYEGLTIKHYPGRRTQERNERDGEFERNRTENGVDMPVIRRTPADALGIYTVRIKYLGVHPYRGYDRGINSESVRPMIMRQSDITYVTPEKAEQLLNDFPKDWIKIKEFANG